MNRRIVRSGQAAPSSDNDEEEDAFAALAGKTNKRQRLGKDDGEHGNQTSSNEALSSRSAALATSSGKRHHTSASSEARKQKLDALVEELSSQVPLVAAKRLNTRTEPRGSFIQPGEEHLTTNVFVGNIPPSVTEEEVGQMFEQFGTIFAVEIFGWRGVMG